MKILSIIFIFLFAACEMYAQPLSIYSNRQRDLIVWDNGMIRKIDMLQPIKMLTGRIAIPYIDNSNNFKIYYRGGVRKINIGFTNNFQVSDNLIAYENASVLNVFDRGNIVELTGRMQPYLAYDEKLVKYQLGDSLIVFQDGVRNSFKAYYNGQIIALENFLAAEAVNAIRVSDNLAAYINYANQFYILYLGEKWPVEEFLVSQFDVGRNVVPYVDANNYFKIFYKGKVTQVETYVPESFKAGDDLVAYITNDGYFKIYYQDSVYNMGFFQPEFQVQDNLVTYTDAGGYFKVFYQGEVTTLENVRPRDIQMKYHSLVYRNNFNVVRMFSYGILYDVTTSDTDELVLDYDVLQYRIGANLYRFFYKGRDY